MRQRPKSFWDWTLKRWAWARTRHATAMLKKGADPEERNAEGHTPIFMAAAVNNLEVTDRLIMADVDVDARDVYGQTALMHAVATRARDTAHILVMGAECDIEAQDDLGRTALMHAARTGDPVVTRLLLNGGAEIDKADREKRTALMHGVHKDAADAVTILLEAGADARVVDHVGKSALDHAPKTSTLKAALAAAIRAQADAAGRTH